MPLAEQRQGDPASGPVLLGVDAGQTVVKAVVQDARLRLLGAGSATSPLETPGPRKVERRQDALWEQAAGAIREAVRNAGVSAARIAAVGVVGHGDGLHLVDHDDRPVGPAITAMDSRAHRQLETVLADRERTSRILRRSGQIPFPPTPPLLLAWLAEHHPERLDRASALLSCKDLLRLRLTGEVATDRTDASASFLDARTGEWSRDLVRDFGFGQRSGSGGSDAIWRILPPLRDSDAVAGRVTAAASAVTGLRTGTPVVTGCHDVHANALGMGALRDDALTVVSGSYSINAVVTDSYRTDARWQARRSVLPGLWMPMSTSPTASSVLEWLLRTVQASAPQARDELFDRAGRLAAEQPRDLPLFLPFLYGSPFGDPRVTDATGGILGLRGEHTPAHLLLGLLHSVALVHRWHVHALRETFGQSHTLRLGGGMARSGLFAGILADALQQQVEIAGPEEAGSFGAAALAGQGVGVFPDRQAAQGLVDVTRRHTPRPGGAAVWDRRDAVFQDAVDTLAPWWGAHRHGDVDQTEEGPA